MKILTKKKQKEIINAIIANQIILNTFDGTNGIEKFQSFSQFCENSAMLIFKIGGMEALNEAKGFIYNDTDNRK